MLYSSVGLITNQAVFGSLAVAGREDGIDNAFEPIFPQVGLAVLAVLAQTVDEEVDLPQVEGDIGQNLAGILDERVALRLGVYRLQIHLLDVVGHLDGVVGVVILLAGISQVEVANSCKVMVVSLLKYFFSSRVVE